MVLLQPAIIVITISSSSSSSSGGGGGGGGGSSSSSSRITIIIIITWEAEDVSIGSSADGELNQNGIISVTWQFQIVRLTGYYCLVLFLSASEPSLNFGNSKVAYEPVPGIQIVRGRRGQSKESKKKTERMLGRATPYICTI